MGIRKKRMQLGAGGVKKVSEKDPLVEAVKEMSANLKNLCAALTADCGGGDSGICEELERTNAQIDKLGEDTNGKLEDFMLLILQGMNRY